MIAELSKRFDALEKENLEYKKTIIETNNMIKKLINNNKETITNRYSQEEFVEENLQNKNLNDIMETNDINKFSHENYNEELKNISNDTNKIFIDNNFNNKKFLKKMPKNRKLIKKIRKRQETIPRPVTKFPLDF